MLVFLAVVVAFVLACLIVERTVPAVEVPLPPLPDDPWRLDIHAGDCLMVPTELLWHLAGDAELVRMARRDADRIEVITLSVSEVGLQHPLIAFVDGEANIGLSDGRHRIWVAHHSGIERLPVKFTSVPKIRYTKMPVVDFLTELARYDAVSA